MYIVYFTQPDKYPATKNISLHYKLKCTVNFTSFCLMCIVYFTQPEEYPATQIRSYFCSLMYHTYLKPCLAHNHHSIKAHIDFVPCCLTSGPVFSFLQYKKALHELVHCMALTRICYGDSHWKLAEAHVNLAKGYLQLKGESASGCGGSASWFLLFCKTWLNFRRVRFSWMFSPHIEKPFPFTVRTIF